MTREALAKLLEERAVRSLRGQVTVEVIEDGATRWVVDGGLIVEPGRLRFQTFAPGGWLVGDLLLEGERGRLYLPVERVLLSGPSAAFANLAPFFPLPGLSTARPWQTILGQGGTIREIRQKEGSVQVMLDDRTLYVDRNPPRIVREQQGDLVIEFEDYRRVGSKMLPWKIRYHLPDKSATLALTFRNLEADLPIPEDLFIQDLPPETEVREVR